MKKINMHLSLNKKTNVEADLPQIHISGALGMGPTQLAAFDNALIKSGVANYNIIRLSSVIPAYSEIVVHEGAIPPLPGEWGDRLYAVYADTRTSLPSEEVWAGVGWVQDPKTGKGLFVEHEGHSELSVRTDINNSLKALLKHRDMADLPITMKVVGGVCRDHPICALVVAAYQVSDWANKPHLQ